MLDFNIAAARLFVSKGRESDDRHNFTCSICDAEHHCTGYHWYTFVQCCDHVLKEHKDLVSILGNRATHDVIHEHLIARENKLRLRVPGTICEGPYLEVRHTYIAHLPTGAIFEVSTGKPERRPPNLKNDPAYDLLM